MQARIYKPAKSTMQSGRGKDAVWVVECDESIARRPEVLMGWTAADGTKSQVRLKFASLEEAVAYAEKKGLSYAVLPAQERKVKPRNYADNFRYRAEEA